MIVRNVLQYPNSGWPKALEKNNECDDAIQYGDSLKMINDSPEREVKVEQAFF
jgi:hypothetical protein